MRPHQPFKNSTIVWRFMVKRHPVVMIQLLVIAGLIAAAAIHFGRYPGLMISVMAVLFILLSLACFMWRPMTTVVAGSDLMGARDVAPIAAPAACPVVLRSRLLSPVPPFCGPPQARNLPGNTNTREADPQAGNQQGANHPAHPGGHLADVAGELNAPLASILTLSAILRKNAGGMDESLQKKYLYIIERECERLQGLISMIPRGTGADREYPAGTGLFLKRVKHGRCDAQGGHGGDDGEPTEISGG